MVWSAARIHFSLKIFVPTLGAVLPVLVILAPCLWGLDYGASQFHEMRFQTATPDPSIVGLVTMGAFAVITHLLLHHVWVLAGTWATIRTITGRNSIPLNKDFHQSLIESLRSLLSVLNHSMLFLIPGLVRWVRLSFTIPVSLLSKSYALGQSDALKHSMKISSGFFWPLLSLYLSQGALVLCTEAAAKPLGWLGLPLLIASWLASLFFGIYRTLTYVAMEKSDELKDWAF